MEQISQIAVDIFSCSSLSLLLPSRPPPTPFSEATFHIPWSFFLVNHLLGLLTTQPSWHAVWFHPAFTLKILQIPEPTLLRKLWGTLMTKICSVIFKRLDFLSLFYRLQAVWDYAKCFTSWNRFPFYRMKPTSVLLSGGSSKYKIIMANMCGAPTTSQAPCWKLWRMVPLTLWCWNWYHPHFTDY